MAKSTHLNLIEFISENHRSKNYAFPKSMINTMTKTTSYPIFYRKLVFTCKVFLAKSIQMQIFIFNHFYISYDKKVSQKRCIKIIDK